MTTLTGRPTAAQTARISSDAREPGRVEGVRAGAFERLQAADGVVEVGAAVEEVLGAADEHERERQRAHRLGGRGHPLDGQPEVVDGARRVAGRVLDRAADEPRLGGEPDRLRHRFGSVAEAVLEVGRHRQVGRLDDRARVGERLRRGSPLPAPSRRPSVKARPALVVVSASKPSDARMRAVPASHGFGTTNAPGRACSARNRSPFSTWLVPIRRLRSLYRDGIRRRGRRG